MTRDCDVESQLVVIPPKNSISPVSRLPPEVLGSIFILAKTAEVECNHLWSYTEFRRWIYIGHVSNQWRNLVFTLPTLWNNSPPLALPHWAEEISERSPEMLTRLSINVDLDCAQSIAGLKALLQFCPQIKRLRLHLLNVQRERQVLLERLQLSKFTAKMETLCIYRPNRHSYTNLEKISIPDGILTNAANFCRLELANCRVNWTHCTLPNLTHLKLHDIEECMGLTSSQFLGLLGRAVKLRSLELKAALPLEFGQDECTNRINLDAVSSDRITFRYLHNLVLSCTTTQASHFFSRIRFHPAATVDVNLKQLGDMGNAAQLSKTFQI